MGGNIGPPLRIAHGDRKAPKVGAHHTDLALWAAREAQRVPLAGVGGVHAVLTHRQLQAAQHKQVDSDHNFSQS